MTKAKMNALAKEVQTAKTLSALCDALNALQDAIEESGTDNDLRDYGIDVTSLPTFGEYDADTSDIYSWDEDSVLVQGNGSPGEHWIIDEREEIAA